MGRVDALVSVLEGVLGKRLDELAVEFKVVRRKRKFTGQSLVRMLVLTLLEQPEATFADWALMASQMGIEVSATAVEKRFTQPLVDFLQVACQIELLFKLWKSHNQLATHRPGANVYEVMSVLWAKLIGVLLQHGLQLISSWPDDRRSLTKIARVIRRWIVSLISVLDQPRQLRRLLTQLCDHIKHVPKIQSRHKNPSNFQLLNNPKLLTWNA